jgi:hypothetical protein
MIRYFSILLVIMALTGCEYQEVVREVGYKGKARVDPWLAAERFCQENGASVHSLVTWQSPDQKDAVSFMPASLLSNTSFVRQVKKWVSKGGHLVLLVEHADAETDDWLDLGPEVHIDPVLVKMLKEAGMECHDGNERTTKLKSKKIEFNGKSYHVNAESKSSVSGNDGKPGVFASVTYGKGRITVLMDGRIFRNRWIAENDHAALLASLMQNSAHKGNVIFLRGSNISLWDLLGKYLWPLLLALAVLILLWLWKSFTRFGPIIGSDESLELRGYDLHLEALGDFQWRLDRCFALLAPLRLQVIECGQRASVRAGHRDDDFFQYLADRAEISRDRAFRALAEGAPADAAVLTQTTADLQRLLQILH